MDSDRRISYLALALAGFATVVAAGSLVSVNRAAAKFQEEKDRRLELEARVANAEKKAEEIQAATMAELGARLVDICNAMKIDCGQGEMTDVEQLPVVPDDFLSRIGAPKAQGADRVEVSVPGEVTSAILSNIEVLKGEIGAFEPAARNNRPDGFRVASFRAGGLGEKLGFKNGDVIRAVNDMPFTTTEEIAAVFTALEDGRAASITFDIRRDGREMKLVVEDPKRQPVIVPVNP